MGTREKALAPTGTSLGGQACREDPVLSRFHMVQAGHLLVVLPELRPAGRLRAMGFWAVWGVGAQFSTSPAAS